MDLEIKAMGEIGVCHIDRQFRDNNRRNNKSISNSTSRSGSRASTNRERIRCFECKEYDHFVRHFPTTQADRKVEQIQQMFNMDKDQTLLQMPLIDTDQVRQSISIMEARELIEGKNGPTTFLSLGSKLGGEINERKISKGENTDKRILNSKTDKISHTGR